MMDENKLSVVTGAFGYTGKYIARRLLDQGSRVRTLTRTPVSRSPFGDDVEARPLDFGDPSGLVASLEGADILYNTYWVRFARGGITHDAAVENSRALLRAAVEAGVRRVVHISITTRPKTRRFPISGARRWRRWLSATPGLSYAIVRPTVLFSPEDILINNIAWFLRRFPLFPIPGRGGYPVQPVFVDDVARLAVEAGTGVDDVAIDAVGPETFTFEEMVRLLARRVGSRSRLVRTPPSAALLAARIAGRLVRDVVLTKDELDGFDGGASSLGRPTHLFHPLHGMARSRGASLGNATPRS